MADDDNGSAAERSQDPFVGRLRPDPAQPPVAVVELVGLLGDSDRPGFRRLYFTRALDYYAEFRAEDVVNLAPVPPEQPPFAGLDATRVMLAREAAVEYTRTTQAGVADEFDLDVRLSSGAPAAFGLQAETWEAECPGPTWGCQQTGGCGGGTWRTDCYGACPTRVDTRCEDFETCPRTLCDGCPTAPGQTCRTCETRCRQETCPTSPAHTCQTCNTQCAQQTCPTSPAHTCQTCHTQCEQLGCVTHTCETCRPCFTDNWHVFTCGNNPQCR